MINVPIFQGILFIFDSIRFFSSPLQQTNKQKKKEKKISICSVQAYQSLAHEV